MAVGRLRVLPLIETPRGLMCCESILAAAPKRVHTAVFGSGDFAGGLGVELTPDATEIFYARSRLVVAARAAGLAAPIDGPWLRLDDLDGLESDCARSRQLGFQGRVVIHPPQVEPVRRCYAIGSREDAAWSRRVVEAFEAAERDGVASLRIDGRFVDYAIYRQARERIHGDEARRHEGRMAG